MTKLGALPRKHAKEIAVKPLFAIVFALLFIGTLYALSINVMASPAKSPNVMINLITWNSKNGWALLQSNLNIVNEVTVFVAEPQANGTLVMDGTSVNATQTVSIVKASGGKTCIGVGGSAIPSAITNQIVNSPKARIALANNLAAILASTGATCIHWDFEDTISNDDFNATNYTATIAVARLVMPNVEFDCVYAPWMRSVNVQELQPYCDYFLLGYPSSYNASYLASQAALVGGASRLMVGYDMSHSDVVYHVPTPSDLALDKAAGYGIFFWNGALANQSLYDEINASYYPINISSTVNTSTTTTTTTIPTTTSTTSTTIPTTTTTIPPVNANLTAFSSCVNAGMTGNSAWNSTFIENLDYSCNQGKPYSFGSNYCEVIFTCEDETGYNR